MSYVSLYEEYDKKTSEIVNLQILLPQLLAEGNYIEATKVKDKLKRLAEEADDLHRQLMDYIRFL